MLLVHLAQPLAELLIASGILEVGRDVMQGGHKLVPEFLPKDQHFRRVLDALAHVLTEALVVHWTDREAEHSEARWQQLLTRQVIERGNQLAARQVATGTENDKGTRVLRP